MCVSANGRGGDEGQPHMLQGERNHMQSVKQEKKGRKVPRGGGKSLLSLTGEGRKGLLIIKKGLQAGKKSQVQKRKE